MQGDTGFLKEILLEDLPFKKNVLHFFIYYFKNEKKDFLWIQEDIFFLQKEK